MDQLGRVANSASPSDQLYREKCFFTCPCSCLRRSHETGSAVPPHVSLLIFRTRAGSGAYSRLSSRFPRRRPFIYFKIMSTAIGSVLSLSGYAIACRWRLLQSICRYRASSPQGSSSKGCFLFRYHRGPVIVRLFCGNMRWVRKFGSWQDGFFY